MKFNFLNQNKIKMTKYSLLEKLSLFINGKYVGPTLDLEAEYTYPKSLLKTYLDNGVKGLEFYRDIVFKIKDAKNNSNIFKIINSCITSNAMLYNGLKYEISNTEAFKPYKDQHLEFDNEYDHDRCFDVYMARFWNSDEGCGYHEDDVYYPNPFTRSAYDQSYKELRKFLEEDYKLLVLWNVFQKVKKSYTIDFEHEYIRFFIPIEIEMDYVPSEDEVLHFEFSAWLHFISDTSDDFIKTIEHTPPVHSLQQQCYKQLSKMNYTKDIPPSLHTKLKRDITIN